jgi:hypothetical protein
MNFLRDDLQSTRSSNASFCISVALSIVFVICFDGFIRLFSNSHTTGDLNYIRSIISLTICFGVLLYLKCVPLFVGSNALSLAFTCLLFLCILISLIDNPNSYVLVDIVNLFLLYISFMAFSELKRKCEQDFSLICNAIFYCYFVFICAAMLMIGDAEEDRFSGMQLASSIFGMSVSLIFVAVYGAVSRNLAMLIMAAVWCLAIIILSGTRASLVSFVLLFLIMIYRSGWRGRILFFAMALILLTVVWAFMDEILAAVVRSELRIYSADDLEGGSAGTRLFWYWATLDALMKNGIYGGHGVNSHMLLTGGNILHFDLLRFWYDYGLIAALLVSMLHFVQMGTLKTVEKIMLFFSVFVLLGFHNFLQAPDLVMLAALAIASLQDTGHRLPVHSRVE